MAELRQHWPIAAIIAWFRIERFLLESGYYKENGVLSTALPSP